MSRPSARPAGRPTAARAPLGRTLAACAAAALPVLLAGRAAGAQCPVGAACAFGTDQTGSSTARATNANAAAAQAAFLARLTGAAGTQSFDGIADGTPTDLPITYPGAGLVTLAGSGNVATTLATTDAGRYAVSGARYFEAITSNNSLNALIPTFTLTFANPVAALGFYAADVGDQGSQLALRFGLVGGGTLTWALPYLATNGTNTLRDGSLLYAGFVSPVDFTSVTFLGSGGDDDYDYVALDDLTVGTRAQLAAQVVPEPGSAALLGAGLAAAAAAARRRRRA